MQAGGQQCQAEHGEGDPLEDAQRARLQPIMQLRVQGEGKQRRARGKAREATGAEGPAERIHRHVAHDSGSGAAWEAAP